MEDLYYRVLRRAIQEENLEVESEKELYTDQKSPYILHGEVEIAIKEIRDKKATGNNDVPVDVGLLKLLGEDSLRLMAQLSIAYVKLEKGQGFH